jgi:hypothetical protein
VSVVDVGLGSGQARTRTAKIMGAKVFEAYIFIDYALFGKMAVLLWLLIM